MLRSWTLHNYTTHINNSLIIFATVNLNIDVEIGFINSVKYDKFLLSMFRDRNILRTIGLMYALSLSTFQCITYNNNTS